MRTRETSLWEWLRRGFAAFGLRSHVNRIENSAGVGTPDVEGCAGGNTFWVELKVAEVASAGYLRLPHFTTDQAMFLRARRNVGGRAFLLVRFDREHYLIDGLHPLLPRVVDGGKALVSDFRSASLTPWDAKAVLIANHLTLYAH